MGDNQKYVKVEAVIKPFKLDDVVEALTNLGIRGITVIGRMDTNGLSPVIGRGQQKGHTKLYRGSEYTTDFLPKTLVYVIVPEELSDKVEDAISSAAKTGGIGDGLTWKYHLDSVTQNIDGQPYKP